MSKCQQHPLVFQLFLIVHKIKEKTIHRAFSKKLLETVFVMFFNSLKER